MQTSIRSTAVMLSVVLWMSSCILTDDFREPGTQKSEVEADVSTDTGDTTRSLREIIADELVGPQWVGTYILPQTPHIAAIVVVEFAGDGTMTSEHTGAYVGEWSVGEDLKIVVSDIQPAADNPIDSDDEYVDTLTFSPVVNSDDELEKIELDTHFAGTSISRTVSYERASDATVALSDLQELWKGNNVPSQAEPIIGLKVNSATEEADLVVFGSGEVAANILSGHGFVFRADGDDFWGMLPEGVNAEGKPHTAIGGVIESVGDDRRIWLPVITVAGGGGISGETDATRIR